MEAVGAVASFIAIGQALAGIPKLVKIIQDIANTREELNELLFELEIFIELRDDAQERLDWIRSKGLPSVVPLQEPAYIGRLKNELDKLLDQLNILAKDCRLDSQQKLSKRTRAKWVWQKPKIVTLCERSRRVREYMQYAIDTLERRALWQEQRAQHRLLIEVHTSTTRRSSPSQNGIQLDRPADSLYPSTQPNVASRGRTYRRGACTCDCRLKASQPSSNAALSLRPLWSSFVCSCNCHAIGRRYETTYFLPRWLADRAIKFAVNLSMADISVSLRMPMIIETVPLWVYAKSQESALEWALRQPTSPLDLIASGISMFEYAFFLKKWTIVQYWLENYHRLLGDAGNQVAVYQAQYLISSSGNQSDEVMHLCRWVIDLSEQDDSPSPIHTAMRTGTGLLKALLACPESVNDVDNTGTTPLGLACELEDLDAMKLLIEHKADFYRRDREGATPLDRAGWLGHLRVVEVLLEAGCDINCVDTYGRTPLMLAILFHRSAESSIMVTYLISKGASVDILDHSEQYFTELLKAGAKSTIEIGDSRRWTPIMIAIEADNSTMVRLLLDAGCCKDKITVYGSNILHVAAYHATSETLCILTKAKLQHLDIRTTNDAGYTPMDCFFWTLENSPNKPPRIRIPSSEDEAAFEDLLHDIRDRGIELECTQIEDLIRAIRKDLVLEARETLGKMVDLKTKSKIDWEAETFRAIELDLRRVEKDLAIQSLEEFMAASKERMEISPFDEMKFPVLRQNAERCEETRDEEDADDEEGREDSDDDSQGSDVKDSDDDSYDSDTARSEAS